MNTSLKTWLKKTIVFLVVAAMAITLFPFTGLKTATKAAEGDASTFELKWKDGATEGSATIHYGRLGDDGTYVELGEQAVLDTTAESVSLANNFDGYEFISAYYKTTEGYSGSKAEINSILTKKSSDSGYTWEMTQLATEEEEEKTAIVANGSHIYAVYGMVSETHPSGEDAEEEVPIPKTTKSVSDSDGDGIYTIQLDLEPTSITEDNSHYANVLIILDRTRSMNGAKWTNAKLAINTLVDVLTTGDNAANAGKIDFCLVGFGGYYDNVNDRQTLVAWTKDNATFKDYCTNTLSMVASSRHGTNWEGGLGQGFEELKKSPDKDPTYVIFLTDGDPNCTNTVQYTDRDTLDSDSAANAARDEVRSITGYPDTEGSKVEEVYLYGIYCFGGSTADTSSNSYKRLNNLITGTNPEPTPPQGGVETIAATASTIQSEFATIAQTIADSLTSNNNSIDDGLPSLSSVSAMTGGEASGYKYYISYKLTVNEAGTEGTYKDGDETKTVSLTDSNVWTKTEGEGDDAKTVYLYRQPWAEAPGASYSEDNGVTWDLSKAGSLNTNAIYTIAFDVWPSQQAFDIIANLNNGTQYYTYAQYQAANPESTLTEEQAIEQGFVITKEQHDQITEHEDGTYSIPTNTHLKTTYSFKDQTYTEIPTDLPSEEMYLESEKMDVLKQWEDAINNRNRAVKVEFYLYELRGEDKYYYQNNGSFATTTDNAYKLTVEENKTDATKDWRATIEIAPGVALSGTTSEDVTTLNVLETGHKYALEEGNAYDKDGDLIKGYSSEFTTQTVRPMEIDGKLTYLVLIDDDNPLPSSNPKKYKIDEETYYAIIPGEGVNGTLIGTNYKTSELDITKKIDEEKSVTDKTAEQLNEEEFTYEITLESPASGDTSGVKYWVYRPVESDGWTLPEYADAEQGKGFEPYGYKYEETDEGTKTLFFGESTDVSFGEASGETKTSEKVLVTIKRNEVIRFTNLPTGTKYTIVEVKANGQDIADQGYTVDEIKTTATESTVTLKDAKIVGTIDKAATRYYNQFVNLIKAVDAELEVTKVLDYEWADGDSSYEFTLTAGNDSTPLPYKNAKEDNKVIISSEDKLTDTFGLIRFTEAGTYTYTITEKTGDNKNIIYGGPATITVKVEENTEAKQLVVTDISGTGTSVETTFTKADDTTSASANTKITNKLDVTSITVTKVWDDNNDQDRYRLTVDQFKAKIHLMNGDTEVTDKTPEVKDNQDGTFTVTYSSLTKYDADGKEIAYTVKEDAIDNYTTTGSPAKDQGTITNAHTPEVTTITITKTWSDDNNRDGYRLTAQEFAGKIHLMNGETEVTGYTPSVTDNGDGTYTVTYSGLPKKADGVAIEYTVKEDTIDHYTTTGSPAKDQGTITNTHTSEVTSAEVVKVWEDGDNQDGIRPGSLTVQLMADDVAVDGKTATLSDSNNWTAKEENLPKKKTEGTTTTIIQYSWEETAPTGYTLDAEKSGTTQKEDDSFITTLTNIHTPETVDVSVEKVWDDNNDQDGTRPDELTVQLLADGIPVEGKTLTLEPSENEEENWKGNITGLPKNKAGKAISYTWTEDEEGLPEGYSLTSNVTTGTVTTITNTLDAETVDVSVKKIWEDNNNQDGIRPGELTVQLMADGQKVEGKTLTLKPSEDETNNWKGTITGLPKNKEGTAIKYTWEESLPEGYTQKSNITEGLSTVITNEHIPEVLDPLSVLKVWDDANDQDGKRPGSLKVTLLKNGNDLATYTLNSDNGWKATTDALPKKEAGVEIQYSWKEDTASLPEGYSLKEQKKDGSLTTFTNSYTPETTTVTVTKVWEDLENKLDMRPDSITVQLTADGTPVGEAVVLDESNDWTYTWEDSADLPIPKYKAGKEISYEVEEAEVSGYVLTDVEIETTEEGTTITLTNAVKAVIVDPPVQKVIKGNEKLYNKGDFTFEIVNTKAPEGVEAPMPAKTVISNKKDDEHSTKTGFYEFGEIVFTEPGEYEYKVTESGTVKGIKNDPDAEKGKTLVFTVTEKADGTLAVTPETDQAVFVFINTAEEPQTGDHSSMILWMILMALAAGVGATSLILLKKGRKEN